MKESTLYIVAGKTVGVPCHEPQIYSDPAPYAEALAVMQALESETNPDDIAFSLIKA